MAMSMEPRYLPRHVMVEILSRVPATSLVSLRCVCKVWHAITRDPSFVDLQRRQAMAASGKDRVGYLFISNKYSVVTHLSIESDDGGEIDEGNRHRRRLTSLPLFQEETNGGGSLCLKSHCRGLTCLGLLQKEKMTISVHNLTTGEHRVLMIAQRDSSCSFELGFDRRTNRYKLLFLSPHLEWDESYNIGFCMKPVSAEIYTLGDESHAWRRLPDYHFPIRTCCFSTNCNGNPHWLRTRPDGNGVQVVWFDTAGEEFHTRSGPRKGELEAHEFAKDVFTWWDDALAMAIYSKQRRALDFWTLTHDQEENIWSMQWRIPLDDPDTFLDRYDSVVGPLPGGELMLMTCRGLVAVDHVNGGLKRVKLPSERKRRWPSITLPHVATLVSLQDLWDKRQGNTPTDAITTEEGESRKLLEDAPRIIPPPPDWISEF